ncbi:unnamed protein product [Fusarium graminearum]|nr:unnamed protein product [Fusarium graminearum]
MRRLSSSMTGNGDPQAHYIPVSERPTAPLQRVAIAIIFIMTALSVLVWAVRIYSRLSKKQVSLVYDSRESLADTLNSVEVNLAIIACRGPALRPLFRMMFPRVYTGRSTKEAGKYPT